MFGHFAEDLLAPALDALVAQVVLVGFIQRQANEQLAIRDHRFRAGELIAFGWPVADKLHAFGRQLVMQHAQRVKEPFAVAQLIAHAVERDDFALEVQGVQLVPDRFPVFLNFAEIPGRDAEDQYVVLAHQRGGVIFQIVQRHQLGADDIADFLRGHFGIAGTGAVKQTYIHRVNISILAVNGGQCTRKASS